MEPRTMPLVTFRDDQTGEQETVRVTGIRREAGHADHYKPWPERNGVKMTAVQIDYEASA